MSKPKVYCTHCKKELDDHEQAIIYSKIQQAQKIMSGTTLHGIVQSIIQNPSVSGKSSLGKSSYLMQKLFGWNNEEIEKALASNNPNDCKQAGITS